MSAGVLLAIGLVGGLGAVLRHLVTERSSTLVVNLTGAFALGVLVGAGVDGDARHVLAVGLLGAYTTFSTWMLESRDAGPRGGAWLIGVSLVAGLLVVWLGRELGGILAR